MKRFFSLLTILTIFSVFLSITQAKAQDTCSANVIVHYHRFDNTYDTLEAYTWDNGTTVNTAPFTDVDDFGGVANIPVCPTSKNSIGLIIRSKGSWDYKDGIDANGDGDVDNKSIDVTDLVGTSNTKNVYVMQGSNYVYYQNVLKPTYFGKPGFGNVVVIYYVPSDNNAWQDLWTWGTGTGAKADDVTFDYKLGVDHGTNPDIFNVAVINIANDADDQIGLVFRKDKAWTVKDADWASSLSAEETDENGNTYKPNGDRLVNVTDVKGGGYKFIFAVNGVKTFFEDYNKFIAEAFKLEFTQAEFRTKNALTITLNQALTYGQGGPDLTKFQVKDQNGNVIPITKITYDSLVSSSKTFNIILANDIAQNKTYTITYNFEQFGQQKTATSQTTFAQGLFPAQVKAKTNNYTGYIVAGIAVVVIAGAGIVLLYRNKR